MFYALSVIQWDMNINLIKPRAIMVMSSFSTLHNWNLWCVESRWVMERTSEAIKYIQFEETDEQERDEMKNDTRNLENQHEVNAQHLRHQKQMIVVKSFFHSLMFSFVFSPSLNCSFLTTVESLSVVSPYHWSCEFVL